MHKILVFQRLIYYSRLGLYLVFKIDEVVNIFLEVLSGVFKANFCIVFRNGFSISSRDIHEYEIIETCEIELKKEQILSMN